MKSDHSCIHYKATSLLQVHSVTTARVSKLLLRFTQQATVALNGNSNRDVCKPTKIHSFIIVQYLKWACSHAMHLPMLYAVHFLLVTWNFSPSSLLLPMPKGIYDFKHYTHAQRNVLQVEPWSPFIRKFSQVNRKRRKTHKLIKNMLR